jgi:diguanylate cyclase (GGDEF)-like protein
MRLYDPDLKLIAQSNVGIQGLASQLPPLLLDQASGRSGVERLKALGGIWISPAGPLYSVLVPVGGLKLAGYLELVVSPTFNLAAVAAMTRMPLTLYSASGKMLYQSDDVAAGRSGRTLAVEYPLRAGGGEAAYRLVGLDDVTQLNADMVRSGIIGVLAFVVLIGASVLVALWFFNRFLFQPMRNMQSEMERSAQGDLSATVGQKNALKEFHALAAAFNTMARKVESNIHELQRLSSVDGLTGVNNRRQFDLSLQAEWLRMQRGSQELSLLMLDIDYFKQYNDSYGHLGGDDCLRIMSALLRESVHRPSDVVARYGGEEFAILLPDTSSQGAQFIAFKIAAELAHLNLPHTSSPLGGRVTLSIGCATCWPKPECRPGELVAAADKALYQAKAMGRDRVAVAASEEIAVNEGKG